MDEGQTAPAAPVVSGDTTLGESTSTSDWRSGLSEEYKGHQSLQEYKDINGLAKSHLELQKMMGSSIRIPAEDASPEDFGKFYNKLGRPEEAGKYEYENSEIPAEIKNDEALNNFKQKAFDLGLNSKQFGELAKYYDDMNVSAFNESKTSQESMDKEFDAKMTEEFGDKKEEVFNNAQSLFSKYLPEADAQTLLTLNNQQLIGVVKTLNSIKSEYMTEDSITKNASAASPESVLDQLIKVKEELKGMDESSAGYKEKCQRKNGLYQKYGKSVYS